MFKESDMAYPQEPDIVLSPDKRPAESSDDDVAEVYHSIVEEELGTKNSFHRRRRDTKSVNPPSSDFSRIPTSFDRMERMLSQDTDTVIQQDGSESVLESLS